VVNNVGVNINTASSSLLKYVSGINSALARKIVKYRDEKGKIASREELTAVPGMGPKSYEQCAGFLKIPESVDLLDNTWVHPENYEIARDIHNTITATGNINTAEVARLKEKYGVGDATINDIAEELKKPNRDPRDEYPKPIMRKGVLSFDDLSEGMSITGKIKNVVDFGAFVDVGLKETALVHISQMSDNYVRNPLEAVKVGDVLEFRILALERDRHRISLTRKSGELSQGAADSRTQQSDVSAPADRQSEAGKDGGHKRAAIVKKAGAETGGRTGGGFGKGSRDDDGTMYNPFEEAFRKMQTKKGKR
jgi:uncharacterized protein